MKTVTVDKTSTYYLQSSDTAIQISSGALATVTVIAPLPYTINNKPTLTILPANSVTLLLNGKNYEISGSTQANTIPNLETGKFLTNNGVSLLWQAIVSSVSSVFGRTGAVVAANGDYTASQITNVPAGDISAVTVQAALNELDTEKQAVSQKDASGGYVGLTLLKINFKNALNTITSFLTNSNTAERTYTFQDKTGTISMSGDNVSGFVNDAYYNSSLYTHKSDVTVANTVTETSMLVSTITLSANFFSVGTGISIRLMGYHSAVANPDITIKVKLNSSVIATTGAIACGNSTDNLFILNAELNCQSVGETGAIIGQGFWKEFGGGANDFEMVSTSNVTIDTTIIQVLNITVQWGTAAAADTITVTNGYVQKLYHP